MIALKKVSQGSGSIIKTAKPETSLESPFDNPYFTKKIGEEGCQVAVVPSGDDVLMVVSNNPSKKLSYSENLEDLRRAGNKIANRIFNEKLTKVCVDNSSDALAGDELLSLVEGMILSAYRFDKYKKKKSTIELNSIEVVDGEVEQDDLDEIVNVAEAVFFSRDLVNEPVITLNAEELSARFVEAGKKAGFNTTVLDKAEIEALGMGGLLGVNRGSDDPPTFNILEYKPEGYVNAKPLVLVGKGVVYDTGGNNLKPGPYMLTMKADMGGAAGVSGAMYAIAKNELPIWTIVLVPATDNRIGHNALVADDVITMSDGTTVEVKNTDAEGRLILADALHYAKQYDPELVIDMATLTGAAEAITSYFGIASMGTADQDVKDALRDCGELVYERLAEMPYWREYNDLLKSGIADISNLGGPKGGAITAGKFLETFTDYPWIHLDIAGPAYLDKANYYQPAGGTGVGVRLVYAFVKSWLDSE